MVSSATQDFIFTVMDFNNEYNTKLILFILFAIALLFSIWWSGRIIPFRATRDQYGEFPLYQQINVKLMRIVPIPFLFFAPLIFSIVMYREYSIDSLITIMIQGYTIVTIIGVGLWFIFGMHWVQEFLALVGIDTGSSKKGRILRRKD